jgi:glycosyltransferase involved in cell wall biosynthesis
MDDFEDTLDELQLRNDVILLGYVDDATLHWLYEHCFAFLYPSLFEGFGLPVLEAMSLGAPVITSSASSIPEIVGPAGLLVNPLEEDDICRAMLSLLHDRTIRDTLKGMARERANAFSWEGAARSVLGIYRELAGVPKRNEAGPSLPASL